MENLINWISLLGGIYFIIIVFLANTKNTKSTIAFKIVPFFIGICITISMLQHMGFINIF